MNLKICFLLLACSVIVLPGLGQSDTVESVNATSKDSVSVEQKLYGQNLNVRAKRALEEGNNKEAFIWLLEYETRIDSIQKAEKKDTLEAINAGYNAKIDIHRNNASLLKTEIEGLETELEQLRRNEDTALYSYIGIPIASLIFLLICLRIGISTRKKFRTRRDKAAAFLTAEKQAAVAGAELIMWAKQNSETAQELSLRLNKLLETLVAELPKKPKDESEYSPAQQILIRLKEKTNVGISISNSILAADACDESAEDSFTEWDLNKISKQATDICTLGENLSLSLHYDLEKSLPNLLKAKESTTRGLIMLISIAVNSLHQANIKETYKPVLSVSSRVLPRFLQVRIRDNGKSRAAKTLDIELPASAPEDELLELLQTRYAISLLSAEGMAEVVIQGEPVDGNDFLIKIFRK